MDFVYLGIVIFLFALSVFDLYVGVSNDAVNFLGSAIGAKVARFKTILMIAAVGIFVGATTSDGMMDIARHGIFRPEFFSFEELMCIFLAVVASDVILMDIFNTLGMPTSTTVSMVFELLGGSTALALVKMLHDSSLTYAGLINTEKAFSVILAIFMSVAIAFVFGLFVQWLARVVFTFHYTLWWPFGDGYCLFPAGERFWERVLHDRRGEGLDRIAYGRNTCGVPYRIYGIDAGVALVQGECVPAHHIPRFWIFQPIRGLILPLS